VATLVVSEVVTHAVIHARSDAELSLERSPTALRISVTDHGTGAPAPRELGATTDGGRGLMIVEKLSTSWGAEPTDTGNCVWAELAIESR
jgi:anti-sigma regulatory factor (Ser/Thr protein kinase)